MCIANESAEGPSQNILDMLIGWWTADKYIRYSRKKSINKLHFDPLGQFYSIEYNP